MLRGQNPWIALASIEKLPAAHEEAWKAICHKWEGSEYFERLPSTLVAKRTGDYPSAGWRTQLPPDYLGRDRTLDIIVGREFPLEPPQFWINPTPFLEWPHSESNGKLCLWPDNAKPVGLTPEEWIDAAIDRFRRLFSFVIAGSDDAIRNTQFSQEWTSYWRDPKNSNAFSYNSVLLLRSPPKTVNKMYVRAGLTTEPNVVGRRTKRRTLFAAHDCAVEVNRWIDNSALTSINFEGEMLCVPLHSAPSNPGAPMSTDDIQQFIDKWACNVKDANNEFIKLLEADSESPRWIVFSEGDSALACLKLLPQYRKPKLTNRRSRKQKSRGRQQEQKQRIGFQVTVTDVQRADPAWFQERALFSSQHALLTANVLIVGAGSLGSMVAEGMAMAGTASIAIADPGFLETANVGRHTLGVAATNQYKASALRAKLLAEYPHLQIEAITKPVQSLSELLVSKHYDLVICTTADPACEGFLTNCLNSQILSSLIVAWCEPHAVAGHSIHSVGDGEKMQQLFVDGTYIEPATKWAKSTSIDLPGCGASHLPGAGNRVRLISTHVCEHAIDVLTEFSGISEKRAWVADSRTVENCGGLRLLPTTTGPAATICTEIGDDLEDQDKYIAV